MEAMRAGQGKNVQQARDNHGRFCEPHSWQVEVMRTWNAVLE